MIVWTEFSALRAIFTYLGPSNRTASSSAGSQEPPYRLLSPPAGSVALLPIINPALPPPPAPPPPPWLLFDKKEVGFRRKYELSMSSSYCCRMDFAIGPELMYLQWKRDERNRWDEWKKKTHIAAESWERALYGGGTKNRSYRCSEAVETLPTGSGAGGWFNLLPHPDRVTQLWRDRRGGSFS